MFDMSAELDDRPGDEVRDVVCRPVPRAFGACGPHLPAEGVADMDVLVINVLDALRDAVTGNPWKPPLENPWPLSWAASKDENLGGVGCAR
jgi:hypothetical protein